jgi:hypothetical protein
MERDEMVRELARLVIGLETEHYTVEQWERMRELTEQLLSAPASSQAASSEAATPPAGGTSAAVPDTSGRRQS